MENKIVKFNDFNNKERIEVETLGVEYVENNTRIPQVFPVFLESEFKKVLKEKNCNFAFGNYIIEEKDYRLMIFNINLVDENGKIIGKTMTTIIRFFNPRGKIIGHDINILEGCQLPLDLELYIGGNYQDYEFLCRCVLDNTIILDTDEFNMELKTYLKDIRIVNGNKFPFTKEQYVKINNEFKGMYEMKCLFDENNSVELHPVDQPEEYYKSLSDTSFTISDENEKCGLNLYGGTDSISLYMINHIKNMNDCIILQIHMYDDKYELSYNKNPESDEECVNDNSSISKIDDHNYEIVLDYDWIPNSIEIYFYTIKFTIRRYSHLKLV